MPSNQAAWLVGPKVKPLVVKEAPYTSPTEHKITIKASAVAINPVDWIKVAIGDFMFAWLKYPIVLGSDCAGEVVEVGKGVSRFKLGDRVLGHAVGMDKRSNRASEGAFQEYVVLQDDLTSPIPDSMTFAAACVVPLGLSTAACGMFMKDFLALDYPTSPARAPNGKVLLVWGGSTSVGCNAIQLAVAAGYEVITTCSAKNFAYVKQLGATAAFDYRSKTAVKEISAALRGRESAGAIAIGNHSFEPCLEIIGSTTKGRKFVAQTTVSLPGNGTPPTSLLGALAMGPTLLSGGVANSLRKLTKSVDAKMIWGSDLMANEVGKVIYQDFLPAALAAGAFVPAPEPQIVGEGLASIQMAMEANERGLSAKKAVVTL